MLIKVFLKICYEFFFIYLIIKKIDEISRIKTVLKIKMRLIDNYRILARLFKLLNKEKITLKRI